MLSRLMTFQTSEHSTEKHANSSCYDNNYNTSAEKVANDEEDINGDGVCDEEDDSSENKNIIQNNR